jgi:hypothetical protein
VGLDLINLLLDENFTEMTGPVAATGALEQKEGELMSIMIICSIIHE